MIGLALCATKYVICRAHGCRKNAELSFYWRQRMILAMVIWRLTVADSEAEY